MYQEVPDSIEASQAFMQARLWHKLQDQEHKNANHMS